MKRRELELHENTLAQTTQETQQQVRHTHTLSHRLHSLALRHAAKLSCSFPSVSLMPFLCLCV